MWSIYHLTLASDFLWLSRIHITVLKLVIFFFLSNMSIIITLISAIEGKCCLRPPSVTTLRYPMDPPRHTVQRLEITSIPMPGRKGWGFKQLSIQPVDQIPVKSLLWGPRTVITVLTSPHCWILVWTPYTCSIWLMAESTKTDWIQSLPVGMNFSEAQCLSLWNGRG